MPANDTLGVTPVVLLPGLLCDQDVWLDFIGRHGAGRQHLVADYGHADSLSAMAQGVLDRAPWPRFAVAGHSMGGRVALEMLRLAPQRLAGLALLDTGIHGLRPGEAGEKEKAGRYQLLQLAETQGMRAMARAWVQGMIHARFRGTGLEDQVVQMLERKTPDIFKAQIQALLGRRDPTDLLGGIRVPALVACGEEDQWSPWAQHQHIASLIPGAVLEAYPEAGHMAPMETPEKVSGSLARWLDRVDQAEA